MYEWIRYLYYSRRPGARAFQVGMIVLDLAAVVYFLWTVRMPHVGVFAVIDAILFCLFAADVLARFWVSGAQLKFFLRVSVIGDLIALAALLLPLINESLGFLRILRTLRLLNFHRVMMEVLVWQPKLRRYEDIITASSNLAVFIFIVTSIVWVVEAPINPGLQTWIDALYFTVTTLTTTGFGDIVMKDQLGRLLSVFIMIFGVTLFLQLARAIFKPPKAEIVCRTCGLASHDPDARHCKHCGDALPVTRQGA